MASTTACTSADRRQLLFIGVGALSASAVGLSLVLLRRQWRRRARQAEQEPCRERASSPAEEASDDGNVVAGAFSAGGCEEDSDFDTSRAAPADGAANALNQMPLEVLQRVLLCLDGSGLYAFSTASRAAFLDTFECAKIIAESHSATRPASPSSHIRSASPATPQTTTTSRRVFSQFVIASVAREWLKRMGCGRVREAQRQGERMLGFFSVFHSEKAHGLVCLGFDPVKAAEGLSDKRKGALAARLIDLQYPSMAARVARQIRKDYNEKRDVMDMLSSRGFNREAMEVADTVDCQAGQTYF
ncbi:unnamed protein product [Vitrella brassicaformis CCMP3155]|uniref:Uncharacterized protein n=1 Tax=Vitrella brassicaformis (strain CCMP3155) TaxID=1169540 RepID=A0A0G4EXC3_VITBC|nr:unnamed protein product [Vitrella brassicaformis CCMP3155]|eukprot:CEM03331.1 unnamed protein product [Vitrella brassicaformis CCMP3155]